MKVSETKLKAVLRRRLLQAGISWHALCENAEQIIVFGSFALSTNTRFSDLDVMCIGKGKPYKSSKLHIIWISAQRTRSLKWLGSELATHVAQYGVWINGQNIWAKRIRPSRDTIDRKEKNIIARLNAAQRHWHDLLPKFQTKQVTKLRRDLQRYQLMQKGKAPLPKTVLDKKWVQYKPATRWNFLLKNSTAMSRRVKKFLAAKKINA